MKHKENSRLYEADDGKMLVRVSDGKTIGDGICLGDNDDISNYEEREFTEEQREKFFKEIGTEDPKKRIKHNDCNDAKHKPRNMRTSAKMLNLAKQPSDKES